VDIQKCLQPIEGCGGIVMSVENKWVCNACGEEIGNTLYMQSVVMNSRATTFSQEGTSYILPDGTKCREWGAIAQGNARNSIYDKTKKVFNNKLSNQ